MTGVALITFILLAVNAKEAGAAFETLQVQLLVWIFVMRIMMVVASAAAYFINENMTSKQFATSEEMNFEMPLTRLVWVTSIVSIVLTYIVSWFVIPDLAGNTSLWWKLSTIISCGTLAGAVIPELVKVFTSTESKHVREVVSSSEQGGPSLNILSGLVAGNFSCYWLGLSIVLLMGIAYGVTEIGRDTPAGLDAIMAAPAVFAFGLVAFGFLGMGPVTIAVDSYGPVTDNAQSVYELSLIEDVPNVESKSSVSLGSMSGLNVPSTCWKRTTEQGTVQGNGKPCSSAPL